MTETEKQQFGLETWSMVGRAFCIERRPLESTLALIRALQRYGKTDPGASGLVELRLAYAFEKCEATRRKPVLRHKTSVPPSRVRIA